MTFHAILAKGLLTCLDFVLSRTACDIEQYALELSVVENILQARDLNDFLVDHQKTASLVGIVNH